MQRRQLLSALFTLPLLILSRHSAAEDWSVAHAASALKSTLSGFRRRFELTKDQPAAPDVEADSRLREYISRVGEWRSQLTAAVQNAPGERLAAHLDPHYKSLAKLVPAGPLPSAPASAPPLAEMATEGGSSGDKLGDVITDIAIQTLGLEDFSDVVVFLFQNYGPVKNSYQGAVDAYRDGSYLTAASSLARLPVELVGTGSEKFLERKFGRAGAKSLIRSLFSAMLLSGIPFIGEASTGTLFVVALYRNWDRLQEAIRAQ